MTFVSKALSLSSYCQRTSLKSSPCPAGRVRRPGKQDGRTQTEQEKERRVTKWTVHSFDFGSFQPKGRYPPSRRKHRQMEKIGQDILIKYRIGTNCNSPIMTRV